MIQFTEKMLTTILEKIRNGSYDKEPYHIEFNYEGCRIYNNDTYFYISVYPLNIYDKKGNVTSSNFYAYLDAPRYRVNQTIKISSELYNDALDCFKENYRLQQIVLDKKLLNEFMLVEE